jgi:chromosome segregation ATPase
MKLLNLLCSLILLWCSVIGANALFGKNKNGEERRRLSQKNMADVDVDAATGTVKHIMTAEEKAADEAANSCDSQMAQSLVKANEGMLMTKTERDEALQAKKEGLARIDVLETTVEGLNAKIEEMEAQLKSKDEASAAALQELETSKDQVIADLGTEIAAGREPIEAEHRAQVEELTSGYDDKLRRLQKELAAGAAEFDAKIENQATEHEELLKTTKDEAKKYMITQVNVLKDEMASLQKQHEDKESESHGQMQKLGSMKKQVEEEKSQFAKMSAELKEVSGSYRIVLPVFRHLLSPILGTYQNCHHFPFPTTNSTGG